MKEQLDQFCKNYEIQIVDDQKRRARYHPPRYFTDPLRADIVSKDFVEYETEKVFTVQIPESRFRALVEKWNRDFLAITITDTVMLICLPCLWKKKEKKVGIGSPAQRYKKPTNNTVLCLIYQDFKGKFKNE